MIMKKIPKTILVKVLQVTMDMVGTICASMRRMMRVR